MSIVTVSGSFDDLRSRHIRFLQEAARLGEVHVRLWSDDAVQAIHGKPPKFPQAERLYFVDAVRFVSKVSIVPGPVDPDALPTTGGFAPSIWAIDQASQNAAKERFCMAAGMDLRVISDDQLLGYPLDPDGDVPARPGKKKVIVTGCYDWVHTGHVRFFEEVSEYGDLYVVAGNDKNIELLKGAGHPQFAEAERRYVVNSMRYVRQALIASGYGWLDSEAEIRRIRPDIYAVNEDGDKPEKSAYCREHGIEYLVLKRLPKPGLPRRQSTALRGF